VRAEASKQPGVAVIGAGYWGRNLVRVMDELGALAAVCDVNEEVLRKIRERYPAIATTPHLPELLGMSEVDAVVVATPSESHYPLAMEALRGGVDVLVEKPLALHLKDAATLDSAAKESGRILMVGHLLLYHPAILKLREIMTSGHLGEIFYIYSNRLNLGKVRKEENILWSFAPHDISVILYLLGESPTLVNATGGVFLRPGVHDVTLTTMKFPKGTLAHIHVSWLHPFKEHRLVVVGEKKMAVFEDSAADSRLVVYHKGVDLIEGEAVLRQREDEVIPYADSEPLKEECLHFLECVRTRRKPRTGADSGIEVLRILEQAQGALHGQPSRVEAKAPEELEVRRDGVFVHRTATVDSSAQIGAGTKIWHYSHVMSDAEIGENCVLGQNVFVASHVKVGNYVKIQNNVSVYEAVTLEDRVFCGPSMVFTNVKAPRGKYPQRGSKFYEPTLVRKGASIGANATVVCGHTIGRHAFVGAGAVVTKDVPEYALLIGNPGRVVGWVCECGSRLTFEANKATCSSCGIHYAKRRSKVEQASA